MNLNKTIIIILPLIYSSHVFSDETYYITPDETPFIAIEPDTIITSPSSFDQKISNHYVKLEKNKILLTDEIIEKLNKHIGNIKTTFGESITKENVKIKDSLIISPKDIEIRSKIASFFYNEIEGNLLGSNDAPHISFNKKAVLHFLAEHTNDDIQIAQTTLPNLTIKQYDDIVHGEKNNVIKQGDLFSIENEFNKKIITLIKKNNIELSKFDNQIKLNKMMSKVNQSGHAMNLERILANEDNIDANKKDIDTNKKSIDTNKESIDTNKKSIDANKESIDANKESIDANKEDIDTNRIGIDTNRKDIDINKEDIDNIKDNYIDNLNINGNNISLKNHFATLYMEQSISRSEVKTLKNDFEHFKSDTQNRFYKVEKRANQGIASVAAMSNLPFTDSATFSTAIGIGNYRNATALAWGMQYRINENIKIRASTAWNESSWVSAGGVGISW
ncbi:YadA C-terminal domain-containing protein [Proteus vulgaris]|uniref:YadA C-terminal domain-containing protein n=2 Tax=Proteus TaxID=583 RepID=UPI002875883B|nr:YadA C-terminal domain-containing protein [Proteus vulgaris]MDS0789912.1 YadA C-terminal domain-containing protein [Proteus vulgaris]